MKEKKKKEKPRKHNHSLKVVADGGVGAAQDNG